MKTKLYLKGLLTLAIVPILSTNVNAQKTEPLGPKSLESPAPPNLLASPHVHSHIKPNPHAGGDSLYLDVHAPVSEVFTLTITDTADAVVNTLSVNGGENLLPVLPIGRYSYTLTNAEGIIVSKGKIDVKAPHVHSHVRPNPHAGGDSLYLDVHAPVSEVFTLTITDTADAVVNTLNVNGGENSLPVLPIGRYSYTLTNAEGVIVSKGKIDVKAPHVHSHVKPNPHAGGDSLYLVVDAPVSEVFTLTITDTADAVVNTLSVNGGENLLPVLPIGRYSYTLTNAEGIIVSKGKIDVKAPHVHVHSHVRPNPHAGGDSLYLDVHAPLTEVFTLTITDTADAVINTLSVKGGENLLPVLPIGRYSYTLTNADGIIVSKGKIDVKAPHVHVHSHVKPNPHAGGDSLYLVVHAPLTEAFTLTITDTADAVVNTLSVNGGENLLPVLPIGRYSYTLTNGDGIIVSKGKIDVKAPHVHVHSHVKPNPHAGGDSLYLDVHAPVSEVFTLTITDTADAVVNTLNVNGGENLLPVLPIGRYSYTLTNAEGIIVSKGKIDVKAPKIKSSVRPGHVHVGDDISIQIDADLTESFALNIYTLTGDLVQTLSVNGGSNALPALSSGFYKYELVNGDGYKVSQGKIAIHPPKVHTVIAPNPSFAGEATISIDADPTETFTLNIYDSADLVSTQTVPGGITSLPPTLDSGIHFYTVVNANGDIVSKGRIMIY